jgi:hypothetical protein
MKLKSEPYIIEPRLLDIADPDPNLAFPQR